MLNPDVRLEWFVSFLAVVETGSFSAAAETTHRSQPRVSTHVAALERASGVRLFDRRKRPVMLTDAGKALAEHAEAILHELELAEDAMATRRATGHGVVTLGTYPSASAAFVPELLDRFAADHPDVTVALVERSTIELGEALVAGEIDLCVRPMSPPLGTPSIRERLLWREPLVVAFPPDHPLRALPEPLPISEVNTYPLITIGSMDSPDPAGYEPYRLFSEHGFELHPVQATNQPQTLMALVRRGFGVGVTNGLAAAICDTDGIVVRRLEGDCGRRVAVRWDSSRPLSRAARDLLGAIVVAPRPAGTEALP
ncbi:LysR family transcriptional regulator [Jiangella asiatica]|uniref:LysR family transcriptional regulator n=1 Tax=Jiangella asiatica TaxID=2530372 RepID=A0A4R5D3I7_9ACTN|nr:LysR family transcriptional regulator [Jiangella asiatica]TDE07922.1 LysR family transcriptional regulator [Jiangella asiatica]